MKKFSEICDPLTLKQARKMKGDKMDGKIFLPQAGLEGMSISELIIIHAQLDAICDRLSNYDYDMKWVREKRELVQDELTKKMKAENRRKLQKLEAQEAALLPDDEKLKNIRAEAAALRKKLEG